MTVKLRASSGATPRHIRCVWGKPCNSRTGGPDPDQRTKMPVSAVSIVAGVKSSIMSGHARCLGWRLRYTTLVAGATGRLPLVASAGDL